MNRFGRRMLTHPRQMQRKQVEELRIVQRHRAHREGRGAHHMPSISRIARNSISTSETNTSTPDVRTSAPARLR